MIREAFGATLIAVSGLGLTVLVMAVLGIAGVVFALLVLPTVVFGGLLIAGLGMTGSLTQADLSKISKSRESAQESLIPDHFDPVDGRPN